MGRSHCLLVSCGAFSSCSETPPLPLAETVSGSDDLPLSPSPGKALWTLNPNYLSNGTLAAPVVVLPDLDEDGVRDLVVLAIGELQVWSLAMVTVSSVCMVSSDGYSECCVGPCCCNGLGQNRFSW